MPLLPVFATKLGASPKIVGYYLAIVYIGVFAGTIVAGRLSDKLQQRKRILIANGIIGIPTIWIMGQVTSIFLLTILTAILWFVGGIAITLVMILTGLFAEKTKRGKIYGTISLAGPVGIILGGLISGPIVDRWDYPTLFIIVSLIWGLSQLIIIFLEDKEVEKIKDNEISKISTKPSLGGIFYILFVATVFSQVIFFIGRMGISLIMNNLNYAATAIASTATIGGAVIMPIPLLAGWMSDRLGRKRLLMLFYIIGSAGMYLLSVSVSLWQFWISFALVSIVPGINRAVGTALVNNLVPKQAVCSGFSYFPVHNGLVELLDSILLDMLFIRLE
jgi:MFS family permease